MAQNDREYTKVHYKSGAFLADGVSVVLAA